MARPPLQLQVQPAAARPPAAPAPAAAPALAPARAAAPARRPRVPLDAFELARLEQLSKLVGERLAGWGVDEEGRWFVDVTRIGFTTADGPDSVVRHFGGGLHAAIGNALAANGGAR